MKKESEAIEADIISLIIHMGGCVSWEEAWMTTTENRKHMVTAMNKVKTGK